MMKNRRGEKINFGYNFKQYLAVLKNYRRMFSWLLVIILIAEALSLAEGYLFKEVVDNGSGYLSGTITQSVFVDALIIVLLIFAGAIILRTITKWVIVRLMNLLTSQMIKDIKVKYFKHILQLSHDFHTTHKTGSLISRLGRGSGAAEGMTDILSFQILPLIFKVVIVGASIAYFETSSALTMLGIAVCFIGYSLYIQHIQQDSKLKYINAQDREKGFIGDVFTNVDSIKFYGKEKNIGSRFDKFTQTTREKAVKYWSYYKWFDAGQILILGIGTFLMAYFPLVALINQEITIGTFVFIYSMYGSIVSPMMGFVWGIRGFYRYMADFQDLFEYGKIENDIKDKPGAKNFQIKKGEVEFRNVDFSYGKKKIFSNFNLKIKPNEKVALVGHSGSGKTTLIKLINRFYDVDKGKILIDGKDIRDYKQEFLRSESGIVPQECILFDDTLYNNIKFGNLSASRKNILKAIKFAQLENVVKGFPYKEKTIVGERGVRLSGGEKQRVSIARAILANKKLLILDEATSSLDSETEVEIQKALSKLLEGRTSIIIAHRLSTIMNADKIVVLKKGKIIQMGSHEELIQQPGEYKKLWNLQKGGYVK